MALLNALFWWMIVFNFNKLFAFLQLDRQGQESREKGHGFLKFLATTALLTTVASKGKDVVMRGTGMRALQRQGVAASEAASARSAELAELRLHDQAATIAQGAQAGKLGAANATATQAAEAQEQLGSLDRQVADLDRTIANPQADQELLDRVDSIQGQYDQRAQELRGVEREAETAKQDITNLESAVVRDQARWEAANQTDDWDGMGKATESQLRNEAALTGRQDDLLKIDERRELAHNLLDNERVRLDTARMDVEHDKALKVERAIEQRDGIWTGPGQRQGGALAERENLRGWLNSPQVKHDLDLARRGAEGTLGASPQDIAQAERNLRRSPEWEKVQRRAARASVRSQHWRQKYGGRGR
jgi:hypothetical protein